MKQNARPASIRVILADDHQMVRSAIQALIRRMDGVEVIAEASDGEELIRLVNGLEPDVVLTDIAMPGMDGLRAIAHLQASHPNVRMVVLSSHDTAALIRQAVAAGACGYLMKNASLEDLEQTIRGVMEQGRHFGSSIAEKLLAPVNAAEELTSREVEIVALLAAGQSNKEIGFQMGLSSKTIGAQRLQIMEKLGVKSLPALTLFALRTGLIQA